MQKKSSESTHKNGSASIISSMNINIGQRLEEKRKSQGIALAEASQATKIRSDFLLNFESNHFEFDLPEVYKQGFLKNYAHYLRLDPEKILTDYRAFHLGSSLPPPKKESKEPKESYGRLAASEASVETLAFEEPEAIPPQESFLQLLLKNKDSYLKFLMVGAITVGVLFTLGYKLYRSKHPALPAADSPAALQAAFSTPESPYTSAALAEVPSETIALIASGNVEIIIREETTKKRIYAGTLQSGDKETLVRQGPIKIHFSEGTHLVIERASGEKLKPSRSGTGWIEIR